MDSKGEIEGQRRRETETKLKVPENLVWHDVLRHENTGQIIVVHNYYKLILLRPSDIKSSTF